MTAIACHAAAPAPADASPPAPAPTSRLGGILLPSCVTSHDPRIAGNCTLDDLINTGVNVANFLMGLAAAIFLAIFVWAGFQYVFFAYDSGAAGKAKGMLVSSVIAMLIILGATTIIKFVHKTATGDVCVEKYGVAYSCQPTQGMSREVKNSCKRDGCQGKDISCCLISATPPPTPAH